MEEHMENMAQELDDKERTERMAARNQKKAIKGPPDVCPQMGGPQPPAAQEDQGDEKAQPPAAPTQEDPHSSDGEEEEGARHWAPGPLGKSGRPIWPRHLKPMYPGCMDEFSIEASSEEEPEWTTQEAAIPNEAQEAQEQEKEKEKGKRLQEVEAQARKHQKAMGKGKGEEASASTTGPGAKMSDE
jgi:hypothetical protein